MTGKTITLTSADGFEFSAYHAQPPRRRVGGLILIQEIFGINKDIKRLSDLFASHGFEVIAPSMYDRVEKDFALDDHSMKAIERAIAGRANIDDAMADVSACAARLKGQGGVHITGFCYGGFIAFLAACRVSGLASSASYYGGRIAQYANEKPKCPFIAHFGAKDSFIPAEQVDALRRAQPDIPVYVYDAGHGFSREGSADFHEPSHKLALERTLKLFADTGAA